MPVKGKAVQFRQSADQALKSLKAMDRSRSQTIKQEDIMAEQNTVQAEPQIEPQIDDTPKTYTDEEVDAIVAKKLAREKKKNEQAIKDAVAEAQKLAQMDEAERAKHEHEELMKELTALRQERAREEMTKTARGILKSNGINADDALVSMLIRDDAEQTAEAVKSFSALFASAVQDGIKDALRGNTPAKGPAPTITKEEILAIEDRTKRLKAINENLNLFQK